MYPYLSVFGLNIPMYGLMMAVAFLLCSVLAFFRTRKRGRIGENLIIIAAMVLLFALIGGILFFDLVTYSPEQIGQYIRTGRWDPLLRGGIVFYGALIGGAIGAFIGSLIAKDDLREYLDIVVPVIPLGHAIGRIGCFCAGCCYGHPTDSPLGVIYTHPAGGAPAGISLLPLQLIESGVNLVIFGILMLVSSRTVSRYLTTILYCILYGTARFILEFFRYDSIRGMAWGLSTSQWVSLGLIAGALLAGLLYHFYKKSGRSIKANE
ncbi:MAG: prolipoprotein diacylglyceryl transferase [Parasporobacterium sp.]|nr:prolipoprotein diacylglyceryl transferase [Parasporobacterium sp.]